MILVFGHRIDLILVLAVVLVALSVLYGMFILVLSRFEPQRSQHRRVKIATVPGHHKVVFVIPCLNEERVLRPSLERLVGLDHPDLQIMVIDDGSDDGTAEIVRSFPDPRVHLF